MADLQEHIFAYVNSSTGVDADTQSQQPQPASGSPMKSEGAGSSAAPPSKARD